MVRFLPPQPSLVHLKNEAKLLHKAHQGKNPEVCPTLRRLHRFENASDEQILATDLPLTEVQFALAMDYGFKDWAGLRQAVLSLKPTEDYAPDAQSDALLLPTPPAGIGGVNRFAAALSMAASYLGTPADSTAVAGDSGLAFIFQADSLLHPWDTNTRQLDMGWWPLDSWGATLRLNFLGRAYGIPMRLLPSIKAEYIADSAMHFQKYHQPEVLLSLQAGRPVVAVGLDIYFVCGYDSGNPPLLGQTSCEAALNIHRMEKFPWEVIVLGEAVAPMDRPQTDVEALDFAIRLGRDETDLSALPGKSAGRRSWDLWMAQLEDPELCGPHFYHANVVGHLHQNRAAAVKYLRAMSKRYSPLPSNALTAAAVEYETVLNKLEQIYPGKETLTTSAGRERLISVIREIMSLEARAQEQMGKALEAMR